MSDNFQTTSHDLWIEARKMTISVAQVTGTPSTLRITWTLPPTPYTAYAGGIVLLSEEPISGDNTPEDGKKYTASSNWSSLADTIGTAKVVGAYYGYFGDNITTVSVDVSNTDPSKLYYASFHAASSILQYYPIGVHSYPLNSDRFQRSSDAFAGSIPSASAPPANPANGQVYFDPVINKVLMWNATTQAWLEADGSTVEVGERLPIEDHQLFINYADVKLRFFISGMWVDCNASNTRIKSGGSWVPLGTVVMGEPGGTPVAGNIKIIFESSPRGVSVGAYTAKVYLFGQWLPLSANLVQFQSAPSTWVPVVFGNVLFDDQNPPIPEIGTFFYKTSTKDLMVWSDGAWVKADTESEGTPTYDKIGVGDDGSYDERLDLIRQLKTQMGWPSVCIELSEEAFNVAIDNALATFRQRADNAYQHRYILFTFQPNQQVYYLNDPRQKTDRVVNILRLCRVNQLGSSDLADPIYGQLLIPQGLTNGNFDLVSIHLMHQLSETWERIFAGNIMHTWDESSRQLMIHRQITLPERVVMEVALERTEQELLLDRWCEQWIQAWALAELKETLGMIRSKYGSVAGPNGGVTLNGDLLLSEARLDFEDLQRQLNDYEVGNGGTAFGNTSFFIM